MLIFRGLRCSQKAIDTALKKAIPSQKLVILAAIDSDLAACFLPGDVAFCPGGMKAFRQELSRHLAQIITEKLQSTVEKARLLGVQVTIHVATASLSWTGRYLMEEIKPSLIIAHHCSRPSYLIRLFPNPIQSRISASGLAVMEV